MKKFFLPAFALLTALALSAFTASKHESKSAEDRQWYIFNGDDQDDPGDYVLSGDGTDEPYCEPGTAVRCAVFAFPGSGSAAQPDLTDQGKTIRDKAQ